MGPGRHGARGPQCIAWNVALIAWNVALIVCVRWRLLSTWTAWTHRPHPLGAPGSSLELRAYLAPLLATATPRSNPAPCRYEEVVLQYAHDDPDALPGGSGFEELKKKHEAMPLHIRFG